MMPTLPFVGRELELAALRETCAEAGTAIVIAEAGLGKSRLVAELGKQDGSLTLLVAVGASELSNSPYAVFRALAMQASRLLPPRGLGWTDEELDMLSPVFPELRTTGERAEATTAVRRQELWIALLRYFDALAVHAGNRIVVVVEDLHVVDEASLALFAWLSSQPVGMAMIGTTHPNPPGAVTKLPMIGLRPLGMRALDALLRETGTTTIDAATLLERTDGSPLRLHKWWLGQSFGNAGATADAFLARLLDGSSDDAVATLRSMAVFPATMDVHTLESVIETERTMYEVLAELERLGLVKSQRDHTWGFADEDHRAALLSSFDDDLRRSTERRLLERLSDRFDDRPELLGHAAAIATDLNDEPGWAASLHLAAARYAQAQLSPETALTHFRSAVEPAARAGDDDVLLGARLGLALLLADASDPGTSAALAPIYPLAERLGDGDSFARAALAEPVAGAHVGQPISVDQAVTGVLRTAASLVRDPGLHARVLLALAERSGERLPAVERQELVDRADHLAAEAKDASIEALVVGSRLRRRGLERPDTVARADRLLRELSPTDDGALALLDVSVTHACRNGNLTSAEVRLRRIDDRATSIPVAVRWSALCKRAGIAYARGSVEVARSLALEALHLSTGTRLDAVALDHFGLQLAALLRERRKLAELRPTVETWVLEHPDHALFRAWRAWLCAASGDRAAARTDLEVVFALDLETVLDDMDGPAAIALAIEAAFLLGGDDATGWSARAHAALEPLAEEWIVSDLGSMVHGPVVRVMALASALAGEFERALRENARSHDGAAAAGALLYGWHALRDRALILRSAGRSDEAATVLAEAIERYRAAGLLRQADWLGDVLGDLDDPGPGTADGRHGSAAAVGGEFRRDGQVWHVGLGDEAGIVRHLKGMAMIAVLLDNPARDIAAVTLAVVADGASPQDTHRALRAMSRQTVVDDQAVAAYHRRLDEIVAELDRADRRGDADASERLSGEFASITAELEATHGLGGRRRAMTTDDERARVRVTKAIGTALRRIGEQAPTLASHLMRSIDTGRNCCYRPDPLRQIEWRLS